MSDGLKTPVNIENFYFVMSAAV